MALPANSSSQPPAVPLPEFQGPLDLLLDEVRRSSTSPRPRFRTAADRNLNLDIEWLHMAASHWKSRSLLPQDASSHPQKDSIRNDLIQQLLAHRRQAADELGRRQLIE